MRINMFLLLFAAAMLSESVQGGVLSTEEEATAQQQWSHDDHPLDVPPRSTPSPDESPFPNLSLPDAVKADNLNAVKYLVNRLGYGFRLIHFAAAHGSLNTLKYLIEEAGVDKNEKSELGQFTPLHLALLKNHTHIGNYLIDEGVHVNARTSKGITPLHMALGGGYGSPEEDNHPHLLNDEDGDFILHNVSRMCGSLNITRRLIRGGADVNVRATNGDTPIHFAARADCDLEMVQVLAESGANLTARNDDDDIALFMCRVDGPVFKYILDSTWNTWISKGRHLWGDEIGKEGVSIWARDEYGESALHRAATASSMRSIKYLVEHGADVNDKQPRCNCSALHYAAGSGDDYSFEPVTYLVEHGALINAKNVKEYTPLHYAAQAHKYSENVDTIKYLVVKGSDVKARTIEGKTPLHMVAARQRFKAIPLLIQAGSDVNARDNKGNTPLHDFALKDYGDKENLETGKLLLKFGARLDARNHEGKIPRDLAQGEWNLST